MNHFNRRSFIQSAVLLTAALITENLPAATLLSNKRMRVRLLRHASLLIEAGGKKILVDPMLSKKEALDPIPNAPNNLRIPLVDLPLTEDELQKLLYEIDAVVVTHTHRDHWDIAAQQQIPKDKLIICQPSDELKIKEQGFINVQAVDKTWQWDKLTFHRTAGQHGTGDVGKRMGNVSGFMIEYKQQRLYIAGDTIWCSDTEKAIDEYHPTHIIINGGGAQFLQGGPITMTTADLVSLSKYTNTKTTVVHLESINHCLQRRTDFKNTIEKNNLSRQVNVPSDGEWITID